MKKVYFMGAALAGLAGVFMLNALHTNDGAERSKASQLNKHTSQPNKFSDFLKKPMSQKQMVNKDEKVDTTYLQNAMFEHKVKESLYKQKVEKILKPYNEQKVKFQEKVWEIKRSYHEKMAEALKNGDMQTYGKLKTELVGKMHVVSRLMYELQNAARKNDYVKVQEIASKIKSIVGEEPPIHPFWGKTEDEIAFIVNSSS